MNIQNNIVNSITIKIDDRSIDCFITDDGAYLIDERIKEFLSKDHNAEPFVFTILLGTKSFQKTAYTLSDVINNLKPRFLKELASEGLFYKIDKAIEVRDNPKERVLSDFDRAILKALNYNPNKVEK